MQFDFCVLSGNQGVMDETITELGGSIHYIKLSWRFVWQFFLMLRREKYDVVHSHVAFVSGFILLMARLAGIKKRVCHFRNTSDGRSSWLRSMRNGLLRFLIRHNATSIIGVCEGALAGFMGANWRNLPKCKVVYNGFPTTQITHQLDFWQELIPNYSGKKIIINVARMDVQKNHLRQLQIFYQVTRIHPHVHMILIGLENSETKAQLIEYLAQVGISDKVSFLGLKSDVMLWLRHADVMLFPSLWEGLPGAVIEAASVGVPVVASDLPGVREIARQLPVVNALPLNETNTIWAEHLVRQFKRDDNKLERVKQFECSDFKLSANVEALYAIYCE
ncbi:glycosyltransferase [Paraglaciecola mesophila]|uniref:glycosyltransferase n=1 Tax=Paraglaciecola mesophila TaxID=197222 RepID=UPI0020C82F4C|nr:glycosyltransferase [Paraglaciecola mesophila]